MKKDLPDLEISEIFLDKIIEHAQRAYPLECCGILAGKGGEIRRIYPMRNVEESQFSYFMDPEEQFRIFREIDEEGLDLSAIYHSHPHSPPYPSKRDVDLAFYPHSHILIVSLRDRQVPEICAFQVAEGEVKKQAITISAKREYHREEIF
ncbi:MAG: M67 family metallopeptidase [Deltaproteobacteria bacterium]|nr:M67 family metallopeptidase [Deltaproteobacteria bacterium]